MLYNVTVDPFAKLSAEEEKGYIEDIFYKQQYYQTLLDLTEASASRFILGQRGQGKTAVIFHLMADMKRMGILPILIDRFDGFPIQDNEKYFLYQMIKKLTFKIALKLMEEPKKRSELTKTQEEQLSFFIEAFYDPQSAEECIATAKNIEAKRRRNQIIAFINKHIKVLNGLIGIAVKAGADLIKSHAGLDVDISNIGSDYIPGFDISEFKQLEMSDIVSWESAKLVDILKNLRDIAIALDYKSIAFLFDKIDEFGEISTDVEKVNSFIIGLLSDTELLYTEKISIVVSLWSEAKKSLNKNGVRFDKFKEVDLRWRKTELVDLMNKRLLYFSEDKSSPVTFQALVPQKNDQDIILELADHSPRAFISLLGTIAAEEDQSQSPIKVFSANAFSRGCLMFCKKYDYISTQTTRKGKAQDMTTWITRLLRLKLTQFTLEQYCGLNKVSQKTGAQHIEHMLNYNLIKDSMVPMDNDVVLYEIADPRIRHLISRGVTDLDG